MGAGASRDVTDGYRDSCEWGYAAVQFRLGGSSFTGLEARVAPPMSELPAGFSDQGLPAGASHERSLFCDGFRFKNDCLTVSPGTLSILLTAPLTRPDQPEAAWGKVGR